MIPLWHGRPARVHTAETAVPQVSQDMLLVRTIWAWVLAPRYFTVIYLLAVRRPASSARAFLLRFAVRRMLNGFLRLVELGWL